MRWIWMASSLVLFAAFAAGGTHGLIRPAYAACEAGTKIDGSTADQARRKIMAAGYKNVGDLKKACDNFWHAKAIKDGAPVRVALAPSGQTYPEGD